MLPGFPFEVLVGIAGRHAVSINQYFAPTPPKRLDSGEMDIGEAGAAFGGLEEVASQVYIPTLSFVQEHRLVFQKQRAFFLSLHEPPK